MAGLRASAAVGAQLRRLHLWEFPGGTGSWNKSWLESRKKAPRGDVARRAAGAAPGEEADVPGEESLEALMEFVSSPGSPWALPPDCSPEDQHLKGLAVQSPQLIQDSFIFLFFTSLRLVDKGVSEVDDELLKFQNLEELVLSANKISNVNSANLPRTLKVLELCGNKIVALQDLCAHPPPQLQHLGLGYNLLGSSEDGHLTEQFWPNLLSLDLSFNNFTDLLGLVSKLATLRKLRVLVLQGNPLALIPGYRGFIIDSLPKLCILDDMSILPDEKHRFCGLSSQPELMVNEAQIVVTVGKIEGVPCPTTLEQLESGADSPVIAYSYYVTYEFAEGETSKGAKSTEVPKLRESCAAATAYPRSPERGTHEGDDVQSLSQQEPSANPANTHQTLPKPWAETIECSYRKEHVVTDLVALKGYLQAGTTVTVMEEKDAKPRDKPKQKKEAAAELRSDPPILRTLGSRHVKLESLLAGDRPVAVVCDFGVLVPESVTQPPSPKEKEGKKGKDRSKKPKPEGESTAGQRPTAPAKGLADEGLPGRGGRSAPGPPPGPRSPGPGQPRDAPEAAAAEARPRPAALAVDFHVQLLRGRP